jgi:hypothetical protein
MTRGAYLIIAIILVLFGMREYSHYSDKKDLKQTMESMTAYFEKEKESIFAGEELIAQDVKDMKQLFVSATKDLEFLKKQYSNFSRIESVIKTELTSSVTDVKIPIVRPQIHFSDSLIPRDIVNQFYIPKNSKSSYSDDWIDLAFTLGDSLSVDSIVTRNKIDAVIGWKKSEKSLSFLRKKEPTVEIISYSPYSKIGYVNNLIVKDSESKFKKFIKSPPFLIGTGVLGGIIISKLI